MTTGDKNILIGIDAGTSVIKSVALDLEGNQIAAASVSNEYTTSSNGGAFQDMEMTWARCAKTLTELGQKVDDLAKRTAAVAVTAQGDGTWLVGRENKPVDDGWIWLDARSADTVEKMRNTDMDQKRYQLTGTGLNCCQMGSQLAHMESSTPQILDKAEVALHPKDWLYLKLTGERVTDPSEAVFTFGNYKTGAFDDEVFNALGLTARRSLLPPIVDGSRTTHPLSSDAALETGLLAGTPVSLGYVDVVCTAIGAGIITGGKPGGCTIVGSTGMHMRGCFVDDVKLNDELTGYVMSLPIEGMVAQIQSNMASTLNLDWLLSVAADLVNSFAGPVTHSDLVTRIESWLEQSTPAEIIYHPYISDAGERGPFVNADARAGFTGLRQSHGFPHLVRSVVEGLGLAARDCYSAMGGAPSEIRLTGGAARSDALRDIFAASIGTSVRRSRRQEAGAAGAAMMAAVANGVYDDMQSCITKWVDPLLGKSESPDAEMVERYSQIFPLYQGIRQANEPVWKALASASTNNLENSR